jgi:hypothetical protein
VRSDIFANSDVPWQLKGGRNVGHAVPHASHEAAFHEQVLQGLTPLGCCSQNWPTFFVFVELVHEDEGIHGLGFLQYFWQ